MLKIGSLCTGYGGLDIAVEAYFKAETVWTSDVDKYASLVIKERLGKPNIGDFTQVDWSSLEPIDILTAGYPCQPFSQAGQRKGTNDKRHIWPHIAKAISILRPRIVVLENVRGHLTLGFKEVLKGLTEVGYDAKWQVVRASDVGAPHRRERLFIIAKPSNADSERGIIRKHEKKWNQGKSQFESCECSQITSNTYGDACEEPRRANRNVHGTTSEIINGTNWDEHRNSSQTYANTSSEGLPGTWDKTNDIADGCTCNSNDKCESHNRQVQELGRRFIPRCEMRLRRTPNPLDLGKLNSRFVEYMMGLPEGWVTDLDLSRSQQLKILGNGVVPQQAYRALQILCDDRHTDRDTPKGYA
jgi:DNA (cytosine-5)-methyltransferase 1